MNYNRVYKNNSTISIRVMCAIVFLVFSSLWLYFFEADIIAVAQFVLSGGLTRYNKVVGTFVIVPILYIIQLFIYSITRLKKRTHALTYVPSVIMLALLSDVELSSSGDIKIMGNWWIALLAFILWLPCIILACKVQPYEEDTQYTVLSRPMWINMISMALLMMFVAWFGNTNAVFHYRTRAENLMLEGKFEKVLDVGRKSLESDSCLLMLRMYALARQNVMGEHLFEYPITGTSNHMLPTLNEKLSIMFPAQNIYHFFGARPKTPMQPERYLKMLLRRDSIPQKVIGDYLLCGYLIDKQIDKFAQEINHYYQLDEHLPKHYREALTLYCHLRSQPVISYQVPVVEEDFKNLQELERKYPIVQERKVKVSEQYRGTYWYYYRYE